ncbi:hypothetical protein EDB81DRAFT_594818, partial [Dactylonectria macrodidyma]
WRPEEDVTLMELADKGSKWQAISDALPGRSVDSCRICYNHLSKKILDDPKTRDIASLYVQY